MGLFIDSIFSITNAVVHLGAHRQHARAEYLRDGRCADDRLGSCTSLDHPFAFDLTSQLRST